MRAPRLPFSTDWLGLAATIVAIGSILAAAWVLLSEW